MKSRGVIYVATGLRYFEEALISLRSLRLVEPDLPVTIFSDNETAKLRGEQGFDLGAEVSVLEECNFTFSDKIEGLLSCPYDECLFLDTDTYVCESIQGIFGPLKKYHLAGVYEVYRSEYRFEVVPDYFPVINTGVIVFKWTTEIREFFNAWKDKHKEDFGKIQSNDQPAFRHALYHSDLRIFILPGEYNLRTHFPSFVGGFSNPKIIHDHNPYCEEINRRLRRNWKPRIFGPISPTLILYWYWMKLRKRMRRSLTRRF